MLERKLREEEHHGGGHGSPHGDRPHYHHARGGQYEQETKQEKKIWETYIVDWTAIDKF